MTQIPEKFGTPALTKSSLNKLIWYTSENAAQPAHDEIALHKIWWSPCIKKNNKKDLKHGKEKPLCTATSIDIFRLNGGLQNINWNSAYQCNLSLYFAQEIFVFFSLMRPFL